MILNSPRRPNRRRIPLAFPRASPRLHSGVRPDTAGSAVASAVRLRFLFRRCATSRKCAASRNSPMPSVPRPGCRQMSPVVAPGKDVSQPRGFTAALVSGIVRFCPARKRCYSDCRHHVAIVAPPTARAAPDPRLFGGQATMAGAAVNPRWAETDGNGVETIRRRRRRQPSTTTAPTSISVPGSGSGQWVSAITPVRVAQHVRLTYGRNGPSRRKFWHCLHFCAVCGVRPRYSKTRRLGERITQ
jgi:hypothetical protein